MLEGWLEVKRGGLSRREFLSRAAGVAGLSIGGSLGSTCGEVGPGPYEGLYCDKFTYRHGDSINLHVAVSNPAAVEITVKRLDSPGEPIVGVFQVLPSSRQCLEDPGVNGASFDKVLELPASDFPPGYYHAELPAENLVEENRVNTFHSFHGRNTEVKFVVTGAVPGSHSRILWLHDSLTAVCYGSFGGRSIYGPNGVITRTVSYEKPGNYRSLTNPVRAMRFLRSEGFEFEFIDLVGLHEAPAGFLDAYDLVVGIGQFEYVSHEVMAQVNDFVENGGNLFTAGHEFAAFRVRLATGEKQLTTYKWDWEALDPFAVWADDFPELAPRIAGVPMANPEDIYETEVLGQTIWAAHRVTAGEMLEMPVYNLDQAGWILEGTGVRPGAGIPAAIQWFATGNTIAFSDVGQPFITDEDFTRTPENTIVWGAVPSLDSRAWWLADGRPIHEWPTFSGHATATLQYRSSGATVVTLPRAHFAWPPNIGNPVHRRLLLNVMGGLS